MNAFDELQKIMSHDLHELQQLQKKGWLVLPMTKVVKEEHLGRCCYLAEEFLSASELQALKRRIGLNEQQWRGYKVKISGQ